MRNASGYNWKIVERHERAKDLTETRTVLSEIITEGLPESKKFLEINLAQ